MFGRNRGVGPNAEDEIHTTALDATGKKLTLLAPAPEASELEEIGRFVGAEFGKRDARIAELEAKVRELAARDWVGVFQAGKAYAKAQ